MPIPPFGSPPSKKYIQIVNSDPITGKEGILYFNSGDPTKYWYFDGSGNRYYITGTEDNPATPIFDFADGSTEFNFADGSTVFDFAT